MIRYRVILKSLHTNQSITLKDGLFNMADADAWRKVWRTALGNKAWAEDRSSGTDTLHHLALTNEAYDETR